MEQRCGIKRNNISKEEFLGMLTEFLEKNAERLSSDIWSPKTFVDCFLQYMQRQHDISMGETVILLMGYKEEASRLVNDFNLRKLRGIYHGGCIPLFTQEYRLCMEGNMPKPSRAKTLADEKIAAVNGHPANKDGRTVYSIRRKYLIPIKDTETLSGYRVAYHTAAHASFNKNCMRAINGPPVPFVTAGSIGYRCAEHMSRRKLMDEVRTRIITYGFMPPNKVLPGYSRISIVGDFLSKIYPEFREESVGIILGILERNDGFGDVHDCLYPYLGLPRDILTPSVQRYLYSLTVDELKKWDFLIEQSSIYGEAGNRRTKSDMATRHIRKMLYLAVRRGEDAGTVRERYNKYIEGKVMEEFRLTHKQMEKVSAHYLPVISRYKKITLAGFLRTFGKRGIRKVLSDNPECVFREKEYRLPPMEKVFLAAIVNERLGTLADEDGLKTRKKLYHRLDSILPVKEILEGNYLDSYVQPIKRALNLPVGKALDKSGQFMARVERKCSPEFLIAGDASVCCMGLGSAKGTDYALQPGFGIFNVYFRDRIIANSLLWVNGGDTLVIDNIEVHPNYQKYGVYIREMYLEMLSDMGRDYKAVVQGRTYNDLELYRESSPAGQLKWNPTRISGRFYSDAKDGCRLIRGDSSCLSRRHELEKPSDMHGLGTELNKVQFGTDAILPTIW